VSLRLIGRRLVIPMLGSAMLLAATVGSAAAKCEMPDPPAFCDEVIANVDFGGTGSTIRAGLDTQVRIWVSRGEQPIEPTSVTLVFARVADSVVVRAEATESAEAGLWRAQVTLPAGGSWTLVAEIDGIDGAMQRLSIATLQVRQPLVAPDEPGTPANPAAPINPTLPALPIALLVAGLAAAALFAPALRDRTRRRVAAG
jgi:hypothetical protein